LKLKSTVPVPEAEPPPLQLIGVETSEQCADAVPERAPAQPPLQVAVPAAALRARSESAERRGCASSGTRNSSLRLSRGLIAGVAPVKIAENARETPMVAAPALTGSLAPDPDPQAAASVQTAATNNRMVRMGPP
jgi:hypothetical protein